MRIREKLLILALLFSPLAASNAAPSTARAPADSRIPLFRLLPSLEAKIPRVQILSGPTPIQALTNLERELMVDSGKLWIKRDDGSNDALGGNKARKLEFLIGAAKAAGARTLVTSGMYGSNHALATAVAAKRYGFKAALILGPQPVTEDVRKKLLAYYALGAEMRFHAGKIAMGMDMLKSKIGSSLGDGAYYIPPGGSNPVGDLGYVNAFLELVDQLGKENLPERVIVPVGSMGTAAGLFVGSCLAGVFGKVRIEGVNVADPLLTNEIALRKQAIQLYNFIERAVSKEDRARFSRCKFMSDTQALGFIEDFYAPGYGAATSEVFDAIALLKKSEGIVTDATYSGKALAYLISSLRRAVVEGRRIPKTMFWLTYNSFDLDRIIEERFWRYPEEKWRELPSDFQKLFRGALPSPSPRPQAH